VASRLTTVSVRDMVEALIRGERNPEVLADLARGRMRSKRPALVQALTGAFDDHHAELATILLGQIDALTPQIDHLTARIEQLIAELPDTETNNRTPAGPANPASPDQADNATDQPTPARRSLPTRLAEIPGISVEAAQVILAEIGTDMSRFPTAQHLVSWAHLSPRLIQSGPKRRGGKTSRGNPYLKGVLGVAAATASRTNTFLGERFSRIVKRRGQGKALVAVSRSILVIIWHLLDNPDATYHDLGADYHANRVNVQRKIRNHVRQLQALGLQVTLSPAVA
jgi:transposase